MGPKCRYSLLSDPLFTCTEKSGQTDLTLPDVLSALVRDTIISFDALQVHQKQPWYCFLTQLAAIAAARSGDSTLPQESGEWKKQLLHLSGQSESPWCMVVEDVSRPAFMQPPVPEGSLDAAQYKSHVPTPDELDILIAKNHDIKNHKILAPRSCHWIFALITLQTLQGFLGVGNYGIIRMNGGFGNRPMLGFVPGLGWGTRFRRDVPVLVAARNKLIVESRYDPEGHALLWLKPWDGGRESGLPLQDCDPLFIEICRRIRFTQDGDGRLCCRRTNTKATRVAASENFGGDTGDPWVPVDKKHNKALSLGGNGWNYHLLTDIMSGNYEQPAAMNVDGMEFGGFLLATSLVRGQGKTEGLHHRIVPIPKRVMQLLSSSDGRSLLQKRSEQYVTLAGSAQRYVLYPALRNLMAAGRHGGGRGASEKLNQFIAPFTFRVDDGFFSHLWTHIDRSENEALTQWEAFLYTTTRAQLENALQSCPLPSIRRYRAFCSAESAFEGAARRHLIRIFSDNSNTAEEVQYDKAACE